MPKVIIDTNVFISAITAGGRPREILNLARQRAIQIFISAHIIEEIRAVLQRKFSWDDKKIRITLGRIDKMFNIVFPLERIDIIKADKSDNRILECAVAGKVDFIISGDKKHILRLKEFRGIKIVSPAQFLEVFQKSRGL